MRVSPPRGRVCDVPPTGRPQFTVVPVSADDFIIVVSNVDPSLWDEGRRQDVIRQTGARGLVALKEDYDVGHNLGVVPVMMDQQ
jgi:hypothetical protein